MLSDNVFPFPFVSLIFLSFGSRTAFHNTDTVTSHTISVEYVELSVYARDVTDEAIFVDDRMGSGDCLGNGQFRCMVSVKERKGGVV